MRIDAHQHFWKYDPQEYPWIQPEWPIKRSFQPKDLAPLLQNHRLDGSIAVQARQSLEESRWLLQLAKDHPWIRAVVGWVDLRSDSVEKQLEEFSPNSRFVGVRHVVQDEPDDAFMLRPDFVRGIGRLQIFDLVYDLLVFPKQLPAAIELVGQFPKQRFVLDHLAKPAIRAGTISPWRKQLLELAQAPNVWCKVSGMVTEAKWGDWQADHFRPYLDTAVEAFGWTRLIYGSDWPVCLLSGSYPQVFKLVQDYVAEKSPASEAAFFGETAARVYGL